MAINTLIQLLDELGLNATVENEDGTWSHSPEYNALRFKGMKGLVKLLVSYIKKQEASNA